MTIYIVQTRMAISADSEEEAVACFEEKLAEGEFDVDVVNSKELDDDEEEWLEQEYE